ncbi:MAG: insulinase family protein [Desulfobacterota bacterium]|nr:insulinase family protein [Thermodesulfobacteriota bacterium]
MRPKRFLLSVAITVFVLLQLLPAVHAQELPRQFFLENGLKVILQENRTVPVVSLQLWVRVGSADEREEEAGMCHFIEHMIFKGTKRRGVGEMAREIESLGGSINAYTSYDHTVYYITIASRYAGTALDVLADAIQHSVFDPSELEKEREVILEEIRMGEDDPGRRLFRQTMALVFEHHPYGRPIIGYEKTIRAITREQMVAFFNRFYTPDRIFLVAVGDFDPAEMERWVRKAFGTFRRPSAPLPSRSREPEQKAVRVKLTHGRFQEVYLQMAVPIPSFTHEDMAGLELIEQLLGGGETSRLVQKVKLELGLVHSISASAYAPKDPGLFLIGATLQAEKVEKAVDAILKEIERFLQEGATAEELYRIKVNLESGLIYDRQTVQGQARKLGYYEAHTGNLAFEREYLSRLRFLQSEDLQRIAKRYFVPSRWSLSLLVPEEKAEALKGVDLPGLVERRKEPLASIQEKKPGQPTKVVLQNGIRLVLMENRHLPIVSVYLTFLAGVRFEEESNNGINHFLSVMLTKGTERRGSLEIAKTVERMAGSLSGFSGYNSFGLQFTFLSQHLEEALSLLGEVIRQPSFDAGEMEKRRRSLLASIRMEEDDLDRMAFKLFRKVLYQKHPYRLDKMGTIESVQRITRDDMMAYYRRMALPGNMVITVVGDIDVDRTVALLEREFGGLAKIPFVPPEVPQEPPLVGVRRSEMVRESKQAHLILGFHGGTLLGKERYALDVLDAALSGMGGRLFYQLRDKESLAYSLSFVSHVNLDPGYLCVYLGTHPDKVETAISSILRELRKIKEEGLSEEEVERAKRYLIGNFEIGLQTNGAFASRMGLDELLGLGYEHHLRYPAEIQRVTRDEVHRVAQKYFNLDAYALALIRPPHSRRP